MPENCLEFLKNTKRFHYTNIRNYGYYYHYVCVFGVCEFGQGPEEGVMCLNILGPSFDAGT